MKTWKSDVGPLFILLLSVVACSSSAGPPDIIPGDQTPPEHDTLNADQKGADTPEAGETGTDVTVSCSQHLMEDVMIPMSDGERLSAFVRRPVDPGCRLPAILIQTPYDKEKIRKPWFEELTGEPLFDSRDYAFVVLDWRGYFGSVSAAVLGQPPDHGLDGFDAVEWIAGQHWSDGKVGTWGVSALARVQYQTALQQPPHLAAAVPIFAGMNYSYEEYYPGGVIRREYVDFLNLYFGASGIVESHPLKDVTWAWVAGQNAPGQVRTPMMVVAGWYDLYNPGGIGTFEDLRADGDPVARDLHRLLIGDWHHFASGGEAGRPLNEQEQVYFDNDRRIQADSLLFFDRHLRGVGTEADDWPAVRWVRSGEGAWESAHDWPPASVERSLYLGHPGTLGEAPGVGGELEFPYDPDDPSPTVGGQTLFLDLLHGPQYQDDVLAREDALTFESAPLPEVLRIDGRIRVELKVRTTGVDTDFAVRLTDVDGTGAHLLIGEGIQRLSLRDSTSMASVVVPGMTYEVTVDVINDLSYGFAAGHRVGLIVTSSNAPRFDPNPNNGLPFYTDVLSSITVTNTLVLDGFARLVLPEVTTHE